MKHSGKHILKDVSRSFYLSIRLLPRAMREPVSLAYLLARTSDTLADTEGLDADLRRDMLQGFGEAMRGVDRVAWMDALKKEVIPRQKHEGEIVLLSHIDEIFDWFHGTVDKQIYGAITQVMEHILHGQKLDIERFELHQCGGLKDDAELEEYCFLVAGCVGEFWTAIGNICLPEFSSIEANRLTEMGIRYGKGLQLINILRDLPSDLKAGRCYLPVPDPADLDLVISEAARWRAQARQYLEDGQTYAKSLALRRVRAATALPGLIGENTLDLLDTASWNALQKGVKVTRPNVYRCVWEAFFVERLI